MCCASGREQEARHMGTFALKRQVLSIGAVSALLGGCALRPAQDEMVPPETAIGTSVATAPHHPTLTVVYAFPGGAGGSGPVGPLLMGANGTIYGTTARGGAGTCYYGCGTVFELAPSGSTYTETVLYTFQGGSDGENPTEGGLIVDRNGTFYGTTLGGTSGCPPSCGTVYSLTPSKSGYVHHVLYSFGGGGNGYSAYGGVTVDSKGVLYGTTTYGGKQNAGTAYQLTPGRSGYGYAMLYSFKAAHEGQPVARLLLGKHGVLYGTAVFSSVFELKRKGSGYVTHILHLLSGSPDGSLPYAPVVTGPGGTFYGTTYEGGATKRCENHFGCGTVYELIPKSSGYGEKVFSFQHRNGAYPLTAVLLGSNGTLYGTASGGGFVTCGGREPSYGCGLVFKLAPAGSGFKETILYKFTGGADGSNPGSPLVADGSGALYGTAGGGHVNTQCGCGIIYKLVP
jgi:hypothetical protein